MNNDQFNQVSQIVNIFDFGKLSFFIVSVIVLIVLVRTFSYAIAKLENTFPSKRLIFSQSETIITFFSYIFGVNFLFFSIINPPKEVMLAAGGSIAVALGLSLKDLVSSIVAGLILIFDRPFQVGDRVTFENNYGEIKSIGLRAVRMTTLDDNLITIPNSKFLTESVSSGNAGALDMMVVVKFYFELNVDILLAQKKLRDVISTSKYVFLKKSILQTVAEEYHMGKLVTVLTAKSYVLDVRYEKAFETDIYTRANIEFRNLPRPDLCLPFKENS